jgi:hypothetical protein
VISGRYTWLGGEDFERVTVFPFRETARVVRGELSIQRQKGPERRVELARVPILSTVFGALSSVLSGEADSLQKLFDVELGGASRWRVVLRPKDEEIRKRVTSVTLMGQENRMQCVQVEGAGSQTLTILGMAEAPLANASLAALLEKYCPIP